jgi:hypothetical protein
VATPEQVADMKAVYYEALAAANAYKPWPLKISQDDYAKAAAAESMVETGWTQHLPPHSLNYLGIKAYKGWTGPTVGADGTEQLPNGTWTGPQADRWCVFPTAQACFAEQLRVLQEPRYDSACAALTPEAYIVEECAVWSTGLEKGKDVLATFNAHQEQMQ